MSSYYESKPWNDGGSNLMFEMLNRLPKFGGALGEDPVRHTHTFHSICSHMRPKNESLEGFKLKFFKFSLTNSAIEWYYSCAAYEGDYGDLRAKFLEEFYPPSLRLETREKIINLEQSRDETLDEYYTYFDIIVSSCPHHGFTNFVLLQRFLRRMKPLERSMLNDAAGGSVMNLTMSQTWDLIDDLAESLKRGPMHQTEDKAPTVKADSVQNEPEEEAPEEVPILIDELPKSEPNLTIELPNSDLVLSVISPGDLMDDEDEDPWFTEEELHSDYPWELEEEVPKSGPVLITNLPEEITPIPDLIAKLTEKITAGPILTKELLEKEPVLVVEVPQLNPSCFMQIIATEDHVVNDDEVQGELEAKHEPEEPKMEHSLTTSPKNSLVP
ncbi:unnamed protein product [Rhodiola kirilowii]